MSETYVLGLAEVDETRIAEAGGKGANLGALTRIDGVHVPAGFVVTTAAFGRVMAAVPDVGERLDRLSALAPDDREAIAAVSAEIRAAVERTAVPGDVAAAITRAVTELGERDAYAVRSSATAEDLPTASFAGQQDSYLNVVGPAEVLRHVGRCWASLFTDRAVAYRRQNNIDHRDVRMAVVVQRMVVPDAAGVLFTADPVTGNRKVASVDAGPGLAEELVSGRVNPDVFRVRDGAIVARTVAGERPVLTDDQVARLVALGRRIAAHLGRPQDIEWCLTGDDVAIVQSRPITTLFPVPPADDRENRVYISVGHQQMMTDAMRPLGLSLWRMTAMAPMLEAGGRLWVDATARLAAPASRTALLGLIGRSEPLIRNALDTLLDRGDFTLTPPAAAPAGPPPGAAPPAPLPADPAVVTELIGRSEASLAALRRDIRERRGPALFDFLLEAFEEHRRVLSDPLSVRVIMAGMEATWWLNDRLAEWLGEPNAADTLTLSAPGNVTSEMGLALLDVADVIRPYPEVVAFLRAAGDETLLDGLPKLPGGAEARDAVQAFLERYGMRCTGEIDITRPRWSERPTTLVPLILDNVRNFQPGAAGRRFEQGRREAEGKAAEVIERLRAQPDGERKAAETREMIDRVRTFIGYREYPKYHIVCRYFVYKQALMAEAGRLAEAGVLADREDVFFLTFEEFRDAVTTHRVDDDLIRRRRADFQSYRTLTPPRVLTSDGEAVNGSYHRDDVPAGALAGLPVSAGTVEGRARVVLDLAEADLAVGDILVTRYTDPSWTPLFVAVAGLVTEVGGLMTHGAVIAREYGLPAVVGVEGATRLIRDGQLIRVHGAAGYVEMIH